MKPKKKREKKEQPKPKPKAVDTSELSEEELAKVAGGSSSLLTNIANMKHESLKNIAQNLRG